MAWAVSIWFRVCIGLERATWAASARVASALGALMLPERPADEALLAARVGSPSAAGATVSVGGGSDAGDPSCGPEHPEASHDPRAAIPSIRTPFMVGGTFRNDKSSLHGGPQATQPYRRVAAP